jgi:hypothetical protein
MMNWQKTVKVLALSCLLLLVACSQKRPVLYPNYHLQEVGDETAQTEIDECISLAKEYDECISLAKEYGTSSSSSGKVAKRTAGGGAVGAAGGAASGAVFGSVGRGAAAGAAGGAAVGCLTGLFRSPEPDPVFRRFVEKCLLEKGYEPIGWK